MSDSQKPGDLWRGVARGVGGEDYAHGFAARFDALAAAGDDVHGEAAFVAALVDVGARILDAGCGTGRVATRLSELGYDAAGVDVDDAMIAVARERAPHIPWFVGDLAAMDIGATFDLVVLAGNVIPFIDLADLPKVAQRLFAHAASDGRVVCGFGFDQEHLPPGAPLVPLSAYDDACEAAGLVLEARYRGWDREPFQGLEGGYAVSVHRRN